MPKKSTPSRPTLHRLATLRPLFRNLRHGFSDFSISDGIGSRPIGSKARANSAAYNQSSDGSEARKMDKMKKKATQQTDDPESFPDRNFDNERGEPKEFDRELSTSDF